MESLKSLVKVSDIELAAAQIARVWFHFDTKKFVDLASFELAELALKARAMQICAALEATLPDDFERSADILEATLQGPGALQGWVLWAWGEYVARRGLAQPDRALRVLRLLTTRFTAEFALRPFVVAHPPLVFATLAHWAHDPDEAVRRLVSEGTRPRLPWGLRLQALVRDPSPTLPLLRALQDDPSESVRRSVANHLNDIAKDHPERVAEWLEAWLPGAPPQRRRLLRHASRTLIKQGHPRTLAAWGLQTPFEGRARLRLSPRRLALGETLEITLELDGGAGTPMAIDYVLHHVKADGRTTPKVFKGWVRQGLPGGRLVLHKRHPMRAITTRRYHPGRHQVAVQINGREVARASFVLEMPD